MLISLNFNRKFEKKEMLALYLLTVLISIKVKSMKNYTFLNKQYVSQLNRYITMLNCYAPHAVIEG